MESRKRLGGTERAKLKKRKEVAAKCAKLTDIFSRQAGRLLREIWIIGLVVNFIIGYCQNRL